MKEAQIWSTFICDNCGKVNEGDKLVPYKKNPSYIEVILCPRCLKRAKNGEILDVYAKLYPFRFSVKKAKEQMFSVPVSTKPSDWRRVGQSKTFIHEPTKVKCEIHVPKRFSRRFWFEDVLGNCVRVASIVSGKGGFVAWYRDFEFNANGVGVCKQSMKETYAYREAAMKAAFAFASTGVWPKV